MFIAVGVASHISYSGVSSVYLSFSNMITSVWGERAIVSVIVYLSLCGYCLQK